ncbi:MAG: PTS glucitol/sorbitol transporter subunit IIA [Clostridiales bacterium]|jgi:PTS system glucitol/sorbitol-specific IIA component|nr:PTS glucitol/sorbitol transporter subunit IIA [Clostridiales bacterium]
MSKFAYRTRVTGMGTSAFTFLEEKMIIFFNKQTRSDLAEYSVLIDNLEGTGDIAPGDLLMLGDRSYRITAVGDVANINFARLGHAVICFDGLEAARLPGEIHVEDTKVPKITIGLPVVFIKHQ